MKAKYVWMAGLLALSSMGMQAKNMNEFLKDLQHEKDLTHITMGPVVMKIASLFTETMGVNSINVLCLEDCYSETLDKYRKDIRQLKDSEFEPFATINEENKQIKVFTKIKENAIREMVIFLTKDDLMVVQLKGNIKPEDVAQVVNKHDDDR